MDIRIFPPEEMIEANVSLPLSKSMTARALIINRIGGFEAPAEISDSNDSLALVEGLNFGTSTVDVGAAGTAMRFLTAYYAATPGSGVVLDGDERMRERPLGVLIDALRELGAEIECLESECHAPLRIRGKRLSGGDVRVNPGVSSQFLSALMMVAPLMESDLRIHLDGDPVSMAYVRMTAGMMARAGVEPEFSFGLIEVPARPYTTPIVEIEPDWSAASYWYSIAALSAGWVTLNGLKTDSLQGDSALISIGEKIGVVTAESEDVNYALELSASPEQFSRLDLDMTETPDLVQTLAIAAAMLGIPFRFTGVSTLRNKETDRLEALRLEALRLGMVFTIESNDVISWEGTRVPVTDMPVFETYGDHRMAMALAPVSIYVPGITIKDRDVVAKSYPGFWDDLVSAGFRIEEVEDEE